MGNDVELGMVVVMVSMVMVRMTLMIMIVAGMVVMLVLIIMLVRGMVMAVVAVPMLGLMTVMVVPALAGVAMMVMLVMVMIVAVLMFVIVAALMLVMVMSMVFAMFVIRIEAMGMGIDALDLAAAAGVGQQPLATVQKGQGVVQQLLLLVVTGRVFKADQVDARNFQLQAQGCSVLGQIAGGLTVDMRAVLALDLGRGSSSGTEGNGGQCRRETAARHADLLPFKLVRNRRCYKITF